MALLFKLKYSTWPVMLGNEWIVVLSTVTFFHASLYLGISFHVFRFKKNMALWRRPLTPLVTSYSSENYVIQVFSNSGTPNIGPLFKRIPLQFRHVTLTFKSLHCPETFISDTQWALYKTWLLIKMPEWKQSSSQHLARLWLWLKMTAWENRG